MKKYILLPLLTLSSCLFAYNKPNQVFELVNKTSYQATIFESSDASFQLSPFSTVDIQYWEELEEEGPVTFDIFSTTNAMVRTPSGNEITCTKIQKDTLTSYNESWTLTVSSDNANTCRLTISKR